MTVGEAAGLAKEKLSGKRYRHTKNVARAAKKLALRWGADAQAAQLAGWLHDIVKECTRAQLLQILKQDDIMAKATQARPFPVWHGPCAAVYAKHTLGVESGEVLCAIACHTTGREDMSLLDKVLFVADTVSAERSFDGVDDIRRLARQDLDAAVVQSLRRNIACTRGNGKRVDAESVLALEKLSKAWRRGLEHREPKPANAPP